MIAPDVIVRELAHHSVEESDDGRWYIIDGQRLMSVTTAFNSIAKHALIPWAAGLTAEAAFDNLPCLVAATRRKDCGRTGARCDHDPGVLVCETCPCRVCRPCVTKWLADQHIHVSARRADEGQRVHDVAEWWTLHDEVKAHDPDVEKYVAAFELFIADYGILPDDFLLAEALLVNRDIESAGQTDGVVRIHAARSEAAAKLISRILTRSGRPVTWKQAQQQKLTLDLLLDWKTRDHEKPKLYPEYALQLAGYRHFPVIRIKGSDVEVPMIPTDGGIVVQLRPNGYTVRPVICDEATYRNGFLPALQLYRWLTESGPTSVSSRTFVLPETLRARERKAAKEAAAQTIPQPAAA